MKAFAENVLVTCCDIIFFMRLRVLPDSQKGMSTDADGCCAVEKTN